MARPPQPLCWEKPGGAHTWESRGLDTNTVGVLVNVRRCLRCDAVEEKPYGAKRGVWRRVDC